MTDADYKTMRTFFALAEMEARVLSPENQRKLSEYRKQLKPSWIKQQLVQFGCLPFVSKRPVHWIIIMLGLANE